MGPQPKEIDTMFTIEYTTHSGYMITTKLELKGHGITKKDGDFYYISEHAMEALQMEYDFKCNF